MKSVIQTRVDSNIKQEAERILNSMGISLNIGICMFLYRVIDEQGLPFHLSSRRKKPVDNDFQEPDPADNE